MALPKIPRIASVVAFLLAGGAIISAVLGQIAILPSALIPLFAGIGIVRRPVWSAYGFALYLFVQLVFLLLFRRTAGSQTIIAATALTVLLGALFIFAGKSMANAGNARGSALPWIAVSAVFTVPFLFFEPFVIPTSSMEDTLLIGDHILVQRFPKPSAGRGDIIVFLYPRDRQQTSVKRIIGVSGDHIRISRKVVYRNGTALNEPYAVHKTDYEDTYRDDFPSGTNPVLVDSAHEMLEKHVVNGEVVVPAGSYFVLGDNRDSSFDSRYWGFVGPGDVVGKPRLIHDSTDQPAEETLNKNLFRKHRTRWERLFTPL